MDNDYFMDTGISPWSELNCAADQSFFEPDSDQFSHFDSSLSSGLLNDAFVLRELIGKLGCGGVGSSTTFSATATANSNFTNGGNDCSCLTSPKLNLPILDQINIPNCGKSVTLAPPLPSLAADPGFAERAAKFSCFGSRSFSGRTTQLGLNNGESRIRSLSMGNGKLCRVLSSPALKQNGSLNKNLSQGQMEISKPGNNSGVVLGSEKKLSKLSGSNVNSSNEESSVSEQIPSGETGSKISNEMNSRKRKVGSRGKVEEDGSNSAKVTGKALMLDEIINYVQSLQRQVEFLSMKLASVNPGQDFNMETLLSKDMFEQIALTRSQQQMYPLDSSTPAFYHQQHVQPLQHNSTNISSGPLSQCPLDPLPMDARKLGILSPSLDGFNESFPQFPSVSEDDLQSIVQMGFVQNPVNFPVTNQTTNMQVER